MGADLAVEADLEVEADLALEADLVEAGSAGEGCTAVDYPAVACMAAA